MDLLAFISGSQLQNNFFYQIGKGPPFLMASLGPAHVVYISIFIGEG